MKLVRNCLYCKEEFKIFPCKAKNGCGIYCSKSCARYGKPSNAWLGKKFSEERRLKLSLAFKKSFKEGRKQWNLGLKGWNSGDKNPQWKGGISSINARLRASVDFRLWRESVFKRDNWTCQWCKVRSKGGKRITLNADHIKSWALYPELRFDINNGRTLCYECHKKTDTYGRKKTNPIYTQQV